MLKYAVIDDDKTKKCSVGTGTNDQFYKSIGMTLMDVELGADNQWYLKGFAPISSSKLSTEDVDKIKISRFITLSKSTIELDGQIFNCSEQTQNRICRNLAWMSDTDSVDWVLADGNIVSLTKEQLRRLLEKACKMQTSIWLDANKKLKGGN